jgi:predicted amidohydrolase
MTVVASVQLSLQIGAREANLGLAREAIKLAAAAGAELIILPELTSSGYVFADAAEAARLAETVDGPSIGEWRALSQQLGVTIVAGFCEQGPGEVLSNSAVLIENGELKALYRKAHLWDRENLIFTPGTDDPPVVECAFGRVAVMICYDVEFPEWVRTAALAGADIVAAPVNWPLFPRPKGERPVDVVRVQAVASYNRIFVAIADRCGRERDVDWVGGSVVVDPDGYPVAGPISADRADILYADVDLMLAREKKTSENNHVLTDRRAGVLR